ncbi:hypothetical protein FOFC_14019 [Fusarium oxysporum]|nr:hypothetical protein FOFC_14019 [Fusarium oxysporum]
MAAVANQSCNPCSDELRRTRCREMDGHRGNSRNCGRVFANHLAIIDSDEIQMCLIEA